MLEQRLRGLWVEQREWSLDDIKRSCTCGASYRDKKKRKRERQARKKGRS